MLFFQALQTEHLVLRFPKLVTGGGKLELHLIALAAGFRQLRFQHLPVFPHFLFL